MDGWGEWTSIFVPGVTMVATIVLAWFTFVLARATRQLAQASEEPRVIATIQPNLWSMMHCDFIVENSGNAPAYDVVVAITPEPEQHEVRGNSEPPLRNISVLRPGQEMKSFLSSLESVVGKEFKIEIAWKRHPRQRKNETISYIHRLPKGIGRLGAWSPEIQMAEALKHLREDWQQVAKGRRKLKVDGYDKADRDEERQIIEQMRASRRKAKDTAEGSP